MSVKLSFVWVLNEMNWIVVWINWFNRIPENINQNIIWKKIQSNYTWIWWSNSLWNGYICDVVRIRRRVISKPNLRRGNTLITCCPKTSIWAASEQASLIHIRVTSRYKQSVRYFISDEDTAAKFSPLVGCSGWPSTKATVDWTTQAVTQLTLTQIRRMSATIT